MRFDTSQGVTIAAKTLPAVQLFDSVSTEAIAPTPLIRAASRSRIRKNSVTVVPQLL
jgi:hypothetical protein